VDYVRFAHFVNLMMDSGELRDVIRSVSSKAVLVLGHFSRERRVLLEELRDKLRRRGCVPVLFDYDRAASKRSSETIAVLARISYFAIADITDAKGILQDLQAVLPANPKLPVQAIISTSSQEPALFDSFKGLPSFLPVREYDVLTSLLPSIDSEVIGPAEARAAEQGPETV
jgi:hypothetical protein